MYKNAFFMTISFVLEATALLTVFIRPNQIGKLCLWGLIHLSPHCSSNYFGYDELGLFLIINDDPLGWRFGHRPFE